MSPTHLHLIMNHIPILGVPVALALLALGLARASRDLKSVGLIGLMLSGLCLGPVYLSGEPSEESVEHLPGVSESLIEEHEDAAKVALVLTELTAVVALGALILTYRSGLPTVVGLPVLLLGLVAAASLGWTGYLGGQIRHTEIRTGAVPAPSSQREEDEHSRLDPGRFCLASLTLPGAGAA